MAVNPSQISTRKILDQIATGVSGVQLEELLTTIDTELTLPFKLSKASSNTITIGDMIVQSPIVDNDGVPAASGAGNDVQRTIPPIKNILPFAWSGDTITLPTTSGGNVTTTTGGAAVAVTTTAGNYIRVGIAVNNLGVIKFTLGLENASANSATVPAVPKNHHGIGHVLMKDTAGSFVALEQADLYQYAGGGGAGGSGSGEINVIGDPDTSDNWVASAGGVTVATGNNSADLPLEGVVDTSLKITPISGTDYAYYRWTMPAGLKNRKLKTEWFQRPLSGYASGDFKVEVYKNAASNYGGAYTEFPLSTDDSGNSPIPNLEGKYTTSFDSDDGDYYELRIVRVAGTTALNLANVIVGPGIQPQGAVVSDPVAFTPVLNGVTVGTVYSANYTRVGQYAEIEVQLDFGADATAAINFDVGSIFPGATIDYSVWVGFDRQICGIGEFFGSVPYTILPTSNGAGSTIDMKVSGEVGSLGPTYPTAEGGADSGDLFVFSIRVPISQWAGNGTVNLAQNDVEYTLNTDTSVSASDTTSFAYGAAGASIVAIASAGSTVKKRIRSTRPLGANKGKPVLEVSPDGVVWFQAESQFPYMESGTERYGMRLVAVNVTDIDVEFGGDGANGAEAWSTYTSWSWRVTLEQPGVGVGFGLADANSSGLVSTAAQTFAGDKTFNGIIGVGTTAPEFSGANNFIHVHSSNTNGGVKFTNSTTGESGNVGSILYQSGDNLIVNNLEPGGKITFSTEALTASPTLTIDENQRVGIGTTTPQYALDVNGVTAADAYRSNAPGTVAVAGEVGEIKTGTKLSSTDVPENAATGTVVHADVTLTLETGVWLITGDIGYGGAGDYDTLKGAIRKTSDTGSFNANNGGVTQLGGLDQAAAEVTYDLNRGNHRFALTPKIVHISAASEDWCIMGGTGPVNTSSTLFTSGFITAVRIK